MHLDNKLRDLEDQVRKNSTGSGSSVESVIERTDSKLAPPDEVVLPLTLNHAAFSVPAFDEASSSSDKPNDDALETIDAEDTSHVDDAVTVYRGKSTGIEVVRNLRRLCESFVDFTIKAENPAVNMADALDRSFPIHYLSLDSMHSICMPSEAQIYRWINIAFTEAFTLYPFIDPHLFDFHVKRLLEQKNFGREKGDNDNLGLIHAVIALGQRFDPDLVAPGGDDVESGDVRG